ncbi:MAG: iron-containing alcohol dehydrogenase [Spirochaetales bacterium]|nr:iron-containing alcohol dehydrogenase [Spirochaetales bacterium]
MSDFTFRISPNILLGPYTISRLGQQVKEWGTRFIIIMDPLLNEAKLSDKITQSLMDHKIDCFVFSELSDGAATKTIERALKLSQEGHIHGVIAVGGEKAINVGRAVAAYFNEAHNLYTFVDGSLPSTNPIPCICVPTTFRSAFVFTQEIPVTDSRNHQISILHVQNSICKLLLMDPNLMLTLTDNQKATLSIELIALATEAYLSQKANIFSDMFVEKGLEILSYALDGSPSLEITTPEEVLLVQAGCLISLAAASSSIGLSSLISLSIYSRYHKGRSLVSSILLPYVLEDAAKFKVAKLEILAHMLRAAPEDIKGEEAAKMLTEYVRQKIAKYSLPTRLKDLQLTVEQLSLAVEDISKINTINTLPRSMSTDDLFDFIKLAF